MRHNAFDSPPVQSKDGAMNPPNHRPKPNRLGRRGHAMRAAIFIAFFALIFAFATLKSEEGGLAFGTHNFASYGWPQHWLSVDHRTQTVTIHEDGRREGGERWTERKIDWRRLAVSVSVSACMAAVLTVPFFFWRTKKANEIDSFPVQSKDDTMNPQV